MSISTVDAKKRVVLPVVKPGEVFDIQQQGEGRFLLVRLEKPDHLPKKSKKSCLEAMRRSPLKPRLTWEQLKSMTREP